MKNVCLGNPFGKKCLAASYIKVGKTEAFEKFKEQIIKEFNELKIEGMPEVTSLNMLCGRFVNLSYPFPNGKEMKILSDDEIYLGTQLISDFRDGLELCFGLIANNSFLLVCQYGENGTHPKIVLFKRR